MRAVGSTSYGSPKEDISVMNSIFNPNAALLNEVPKLYSKNYVVLSETVACNVSWNQLFKAYLRANSLVVCVVSGKLHLPAQEFSNVRGNISEKCCYIVKMYVSGFLCIFFQLLELKLT